jgi:DNA-binding IclR family transcriptional regulator
LQFTVPPGARRPLGASGMGWVLLSAKPEIEIERLRRRINADRGEAPILTREALAERIGEVRVRGYAFSKHTVTDGAGIIAALLPPGVFGRSYAIGVGGPVPRLEQKEAVIVAHLRGEIERLKGEA